MEKSETIFAGNCIYFMYFGGAPVLPVLRMVYCILRKNILRISDREIEFHPTIVLRFGYFVQIPFMEFESIRKNLHANGGMVWSGCCGSRMLGAGSIEFFSTLGEDVGKKQRALAGSEGRRKR